VNPDLARVGAALRDDGAGFHPQQTAAAGGEAAVAAIGQLIRRAVRQAVAALHRQHHKAVGEREGAAIEALAEGGEVRGNGHLDAQPVDVGLEIGEGVVMEELVFEHG